jgi:hypothetical protein
MARTAAESPWSGSGLRWWVALVCLGCAPLIGCGGGSPGSVKLGGGGVGGTGASGTSSGGTTGSHASGTGGSGGDTGRDAATTVTGTCAIPEETPNPTDCTDFTASGDYCTVQRGIQGDGGIYLPGGDLFVPTGGTLIDGDYDLVQFYGGIYNQPTRRTIRLFNSGTYMEWSVDDDNPPTDGGVTHYRFNTTETPSGTSLGDLKSTCIPNAFGGELGYSANGDQLEIIDFYSEQLFVYQRRCTR